MREPRGHLEDIWGKRNPGRQGAADTKVLKEIKVYKFPLAPKSSAVWFLSVSCTSSPDGLCRPAKMDLGYHRRPLVAMGGTDRVKHGRQERPGRGWLALVPESLGGCEKWSD